MSFIYEKKYEKKGPYYASATRRRYKGQDTPYEDLAKYGGDERIRTAGLPRARRTLYQLSYTPLPSSKMYFNSKAYNPPVKKRNFSEVVGLSRLERLTSPLSAGCSTT